MRYVPILLFFMTSFKKRAILSICLRIMSAGIYRGRVLFFYKAFNCGHYQSAGFIRGRVLFEEIRQVILSLKYVSFFVIKRWSEAESFTIKVNPLYSHQKNLRFAINFVTFLALKLIQHVMATGSYCAINLVTFLALKLIQHVTAIGSIKYIQAHILP